MRGEFSAVRAVGAVLPGSVLGRIAAGAPELGGMASSDFHLVPGETPREAANRAWTYLTGAWAKFRAALDQVPASDPAVGLTRERWLLVLFRELGYGALQPTPAGGLVAADHPYPISHVWGRVPLHLMGWGVSLDRRTPGVSGAARAPHALVQEFLNRDEDHLWAVVTNGQLLRVLRDSNSMSGQAYVEFDLAAIFDGDLFSDFVALFLLLHASRVEVPPEAGPADCWLERWRCTGLTTGARALGLLREGVEEAIEVLGNGFVRHPANVSLRERLERRELSADELRHALLRLVYRLLFLFVAEARDGLVPDGDPLGRRRYLAHFSMERLRDRAAKRPGDHHGDLWHGLRLVLEKLGDEDGCPELSLPGIGGLFDRDPLDVFSAGRSGDRISPAAELSNLALLSAIRRLAFVQPKGQPLLPVDFRNLGAEELGSVYESLLELSGRYNADERRFSLDKLAGNERKTSGSYYTPTSLIDLVLDEALNPLLDEATRHRDPEERERALLALTVCDPACGSGHFLVAAGRRIAERLAAVRTGEVDPTPEHRTGAMRDVVATCLYGVDINPLSAELAKVSLWLESMERGKPLAFLDAHIKVGNSVLGTTPALIAGGLPDEALAVLEGDDKATTTLLKKRNKTERAELEARAAGDEMLFDTSLPVVGNAALRAEVRRATAARATTLREAHQIGQRYADYLASPELGRERLQADAWCAAFVQVKGEGEPGLTTATVQGAADDALDEGTVTTIHDLAVQYSFFHWHLEFPEIFEVADDTASLPNGWRGGFSAMLGNPPWERVKLQEQEFFAQRDAEVATAPNAAARKQLIRELTATNPALATEWKAASREAEGTSHLLRRSGRYPLCGVGDVNTYAVFAELFRSSLRGEGRMGIITPTGLATDATTSGFFADTVLHRRLAAFYDFDNEARIFPGVHHAYRFAVSCLTGGREVHEARLAFLIRHVEDAAASRFPLSADEIIMLNPNTGTLPVFRTRRDAEITLGIYRRHPVLMDDRRKTNPWGLRFATLFHMANDSGLFRSADQLRDEGAEFDGWAWRKGGQRWLPLYEAKMLSHYDHRFSTYEGATQAQLNVGSLPRLTDEQHDDPGKEPLARYWVAESEVEKAIGDRWDRGWFLGWRKVTNSGNERSFVPLLMPRSAAGDACLLSFPGSEGLGPPLLAVWTSLCFDYVARQKLSGSNMQYFIVKQLAAPTPHAFDAAIPAVPGHLASWILPRVSELTYTSRRLRSYAADALGLDDNADPGPPFRWIPERRERLRAELDAAMFHLYGLARDEVEHVLDSFFVVRKYEERDHGEFRTKRIVLDIYDAMAEAAAHGTAYVSPLDPPAGEGPRHPARSEEAP